MGDSSDCYGHNRLKISFYLYSSVTLFPKLKKKEIFLKSQWEMELKDVYFETEF